MSVTAKGTNHALAVGDENAVIMEQKIHQGPGWLRCDLNARNLDLMLLPVGFPRVFPLHPLADSGNVGFGFVTTQHFDGHAHDAGDGAVEVAVLVYALGQRLTAGATVGVRRLLELLNQEGYYSLGELDASLRGGGLDPTEAMPIWQREVTGSIERKWVSSGDVLSTLS